jgi:hypothetical protein
MVETATIVAAEAPLVTKLVILLNRDEMGVLKTTTCPKTRISIIWYAKTNNEGFHSPSSQAISVPFQAGIPAGKVPKLIASIRVKALKNKAITNGDGKIFLKTVINRLVAAILP